MDMPIILHRQMFKNKDGSEGILYLISNHIELDNKSIETINQKRWKVEVFHKNIKSNTGLAKSQAKKGLTTFGLKTELYIKAQKEAFKAWQQIQALNA
ncbi:MAG: hypothetical protein ACJAYB_001030 [Psychromonas sp.]|jgi:hypothetical protein